MVDLISNPVDVLITLPLSDEIIEQIRSISPRLNIRIIRAQRADEIPLDVWPTVEILYTSRVTPDIDVAPNLRWIQFHWAGINHVADAPILYQPGIKATTMSGGASTQVAEYILMMLLALGHRLPEMIDFQRRSEWPKDRWERFSPIELRGSTVGIIGYGSIGRQVARLLLPFGAQVLAVKRDAMHPEDSGFTPQGFGDLHGDFVHRLYPPSALPSMVKLCDFLVIATPLTKNTRHLINADIFAAMKPSAYLVDISRGGVVDHIALINAIKEHHLAGAALDVFPEEPLPADSPLWKLPNVLITPHISGNTPHYDQRAAELFAENLRRYLAGEELLNLFNPDLGY